jgi:iron-sulfur cluster repair protein YtfE (RIC family)
MNGADMHPIQIEIQATHAALDTQTLAKTPIMVLTADHPGLQQILDGFGVDTCCGGHLTVAQACGEHGLDARAVEQALFEALQQG